MITASQWASCKRLKRFQFQYPDKMEWSVVQALDTFADSINATPQILDDYRYASENVGLGVGGSQHLQGLAIDHYWPGFEPVWLWDKLISARLFSGIGVYRNDQGVPSFHTDSRTTRTVDNPATWGRQELEGKWQSYVAAGTVLDLFKKPGSIVVLLLALGYLLWKANQS